MPQAQTLNTLKTYPLDLAARLADIEAALSSDEAVNIVTTPTGDQFVIGGRVGAMAVSAPAAPTVTPTGGAAGSQSYVVVAKLGSAFTEGSPAGSTSVGPTTLSGTTFNTVTWNPVAGATSYDVYRSVGGASQGKIATSVTIPAGSTVGSLKDTGLSGDSTVAPTINYTGIVYGRVQEHTLAYAANGALFTFGNAMITKSGVAAMTLSQPIAGIASAGGQDGMTLTVYDTTGAAHTVTTAANGIKGTVHIATFNGTLGSYITFKAFNGTWWPLNSTGVTLS